MNSMVDSLFDQYDRGRMTRRHLVQALAALVWPTATLGQDGARASGPIVRGLSVNHVALTVSDVPRSFAFYERLFGVTKGWPATDAGTGIHMDLPDGYISIDSVAGQKGVIHWNNQQARALSGTFRRALTITKSINDMFRWDK